MLKNYMITALRNLWRNKFFSSINILGLSLGIASCMLIFLYAKDEASFDRFHEKGDRIYHLTMDMIDSKGGVSHSPCTGMMPGPAFKKDIPEIEDFVRVQFASCDVKKEREVIPQEALWVDENFFSVFSFPVLFGERVNPLKELHSIVISEDVAKKYFGTANAVGKSLTMKVDEKFEPFIVTAILKNPPLNSSIKPDMLLSMKFQQTFSNDTEWFNSFLNTFVVLKPNADIHSVALKCNSIFQSETVVIAKEMKAKYGFDEKFVYQLQPFTAMHLNTDYPPINGLVGASNPVYSYILVGIAAFILLIASINFVNLTVARSLKRAKEIGIRKVVGSMRKQLILQFMGESYVLTLFSFLLAILSVILALPLFNSVSGKTLAFSYLLDWKLILGYCCLFLLTGFLAGFYPALVLSGFNPVNTLYGKLKLSGKNYLSRGLVVLQFSLATFFIIGTLVIYSQFEYLVNYDLGYDKTNVLKVETGSMSTTKLQTVKNELLKEPAIQMVSGRQGGGYYTIAQVNGSTNQEFGFYRIDDENFPLFKIPVVKGRNFSSAFPADSTLSVLVNEKFVKVAGWKEPIGEVIDFNYKKKKYTVVGVVKDFHTGPLTQELKPEVFSKDPELSYRVLFIKFNPGQRTAAMRHTEKIIRSIFPLVPYQYDFLDDILFKQYESEEKWKRIISFSALLTIFISCIGLFGLAMLSSENRAKEIGIRKVLGASTVSLVRNLSLNFLKLVLVAGCISVPAAWWALNKWLETYAYRIELKILLFIFPILGVICIALLTVSFQAIKTALSNPVNSLRSE